MLGFLLTRHWRDTPGGLCLEFWWASEQGPVCVEVPNQEVVFFIARRPGAGLVSKPAPVAYGRSSLEHFYSPECQRHLF